VVEHTGLVGQMNSSRSVHSSWRGKEGQYTILMCFLTLAVAVVVALSMNLATILDYHVHMQTTADCASYSGASIQARYLNDIADINNQIMQTLPEYQATVWRGGVPYSSYSSGINTANRYATLFRRYNSDQNRSQQNANRTGYSSSVAEGARIVRMNDRSGIGYTAYPSQKGQLTTLRSLVGDTRYFSFRYRFGKRVFFAKGPRVNALVNEKGTSDNTYFCNLLNKALKLPFQIKISGMPGSFNSLKTCATAMPFSGRLWDRKARMGISSYDVKMVKTGDVRPVPGVPGWARQW